RRAINSNGNSYSYTELLTASESVAVHLLNGRVDLEEARIAFLVTPSFEYVQLQWGIWRAGGIAVPLCTKHPLPSTQYVLEDTQAEVVIYSKEYETMLRPLISNSPHQFIPFESIIQKSGNLPDVELSRRAMILYTSGTTGNPKGVVSTHQNIEYQVTALTTSWEWQQDDHILNVLPMHHVHGIVNVTLCTLWSGACCEFLPKFDSGAVFNIFRKKEVNLFMAVPTIYFKLISYWNNLPQDEQEAISNALKDFRLMVSGSAALPISVLEKWRSISGHILLERYGMTEMGMAISNPYRGERKPGYIGQALTNVTIRIANENNQVVEEGASGEIQVKGPNIFKEYWQKPEATQKTFTEDGWFKTGDIAVFEEGSY
ncbi:MAG: AMP-binding protein, partial [Bacteroidota bacterium]